MWTNSDVIALMDLLREIRDEFKRLNELKYRTDIDMPEIVLDVRKTQNRKRPSRKN